MDYSLSCPYIGLFTGFGNGDSTSFTSTLFARMNSSLIEGNLLLNIVIEIYFTSIIGHDTGE